MKVLIAVIFCFVGLVAVNAFRYPSFLDNASDKIKEGFVNIVTKDGLTPEQKDAKIVELVKSLPENIQTAYATFKQQQMAIKDQFGTSVQNEMKLVQEAAAKNKK